MTADETIEVLRNHTKNGTTVIAWAASHGFNHSFIYDVLHGRRKPSERLLAAVGIKKVVTYEFV